MKRMNNTTHPYAVYVTDGYRDFPTQISLVELHFYDFKRESLVKEAVDFSSSWKFQRVYFVGSRTFQGSVKTQGELLNHPKNRYNSQILVTYIKFKHVF